MYVQGKCLSLHIVNHNVCYQLTNILKQYLQRFSKLEEHHFVITLKVKQNSFIFLTALSRKHKNIRTISHFNFRRKALSKR